ncbi:MAG: LysR family transcriptional regulator [Actinobacteria bacterium]|nr:LysR family transcriptional regulator [Actinomycetota bacterium]
MASGGRDDERDELERPGSLDPKLLMTFREVARLGSISAAARRMGWSQPAVAQQLRRLERAAGAQLLSRHARGTTLTPAGEVVLGHADAIAARLLVAEAALRDSVRRGAARLVIASFPSGISALVAPAAARLVRQESPVEVRVIEMEPPLAVEALIEGQVDAALAFEHQQDDIQELSDDPGRLRSRRLGRDELLVAMPESHPLAKDADRPLAAADLGTTTWVSGCRWCQANLSALGERTGFHPDIRFTTEDQLVVQEMVAEELGLALVSALTWRIYRRPGVVVRHLAEAPYRSIVLLTHQHDPRRVLTRLGSELHSAAVSVGLGPGL